ncbi:MAG: hypothetical protein ABIO82_02225 [Ginsengibacter sp.]
MKQSKLFSILFLVIVSFVAYPTLAINLVSPLVSQNANAVNPAESAMGRINEIRSMDKSTLSSAEKKELRKELRKLKKDNGEKRNGIYLSVGALVVIGILLLLLL